MTKDERKAAKDFDKELAAKISKLEVYKQTNSKKKYPVFKILILFLLIIISIVFILK